MSEDAKPATLATQKPTQNWFASWFDTPYYHILYKERNYREAQIFMDNLTHYLNLPEKAKVLDLACGKGRHAIYLNQLGFEVIGADLSENSIAEASKNSNSSLQFQVHDMREKFDDQFDAIFNLFTSFGYFDDLAERALVNEPDFSKANLLVQISETNPDRFETNFKYKRTGIARIQSTDAEAGF